jgi:type II secretory pathway pseudopilin PulG
MRRVAGLKSSLARYLRANQGQTLLVVVAILAGIALAALAVFLSLNAGQRTVERLKGANNSQSQAAAALIAYYYQHQTLPCPDSTSLPDGPSGAAAAACDGSTATKANSGALPWKTLGLSRDQAVDSYGNYFTYVVSTNAANICETITGNYGAPAEYTGTLTPSDLKVQMGSATATSTPFAIISHGSNGLGAVSSNNVATSAPSSSSGETNNCDRASCASQATTMGEVINNAGSPLVSGPFAGSNGSTAFDDVVYVPNVATLQKICQGLTPGGALNASLSDNFAQPASQLTNNQGTATGLDATKYSADTNGVTRTNDASHPGAQVASFSGVGAVLVTTAVNYDLDPRLRPLHVSAVWTPNPGGTTSSTAGMSIVTRASPQDQSSGTNDFSTNGKHGITFQFFESGAISSSPGSANHISIRENAGQDAASSGTYNLILGKDYLIEAYDDGNYVWARITQADDDTNTAVVGPFATTNDLDGPNQVGFVGGAGTNYLSNLVIGYPMLAVETDGTGYVTASNLGISGNLTVEAWIRPRALPSTGTTQGSAWATILGSWDPSATTLTNNAFRLSVSRTQLKLDLSDSGGTLNESYTTGFTPTLNEWDHIAAVYQKTSTSNTVTFYVNGEQAGSVSNSTLSAGVNQGTLGFVVGATNCATTTTNACTAPRDSFFTGDISDVRVWNTARDATTILGDYNRRLSYSTAVSNLALNWKFDRESGALTGTNTSAPSTGSATAHVGTLTGGASYIAALANYYRPFATSVHDAAGNSVAAVCPGTTAARSYECDFRSSGQSVTDGSYSFPSNLYSVFAKVWGGGGGGFSTTNLTGIGCTGDVCASAGGGGGYTSGMLTQIGTTVIPGAALDVIVGSGGTGSTTYAAGSPGYGNGAGGGGASAISLHSGTVPGLVAGGGGGASFSNAVSEVLAYANSCASLINDPGAQCGLGGPGGGAGVDTASTAHAADSGTGICGGRGGNNSPSGNEPPDAALCAGGGADPSGTTGGSGGGTSTGGASAAGAGGAGYDVSAAKSNTAEGGAGGGGGGGGISNSSFTAGGGEAGGYKFFGYDTVTISGSFVSGDILSITFTNGSLTGYPVTVSHTVASGEDATAVASALVTSINANTYLQNDTYSGASAKIYASNSSGTIRLFQQSTIATTTQVAAQATTGAGGGSESVSCTSPANCKLNPTLLMTVSGPITVGDRLTLTIAESKGCFTTFSPYTTVVSGDTTSSIAGRLATAIANAVPSNYTWFVSALSALNALTITETSSPHGCGNTQVTPIISSGAIEIITGATTFFASSGDQPSAIEA